MTALVDAVLVLLLTLNFLALGVGRIRVVINTVAAQGWLIAVLPLALATELGPRPFLVALGTVALKGVFIPYMLHRAMRQARIKREMEPFLGLVPAMLLEAAVTGLALALLPRFPMASGSQHLLLLPAAVSTAVAGMILLTTRLKAISQVLGYLLLENGIFIFAIQLLDAMPLLVEVGVLLDLVVTIFVVTIIVHAINREFSSLDTRHLATLKD